MEKTFSLFVSNQLPEIIITDMDRFQQITRNLLFCAIHHSNKLIVVKLLFD